MLVALDAGVIALASIVAWAARRNLMEGWWQISWEHFVKESLLLFTIPITLYAIWIGGLYRPRRDRSVASEIGAILRASAISIGVLVIVLWVVDNSLVGDGPYEPLRITTAVGEFVLYAGRVQIGMLVMLLPAALSIHRSVFRFALRIIRSRGWNQRHAIIIGTGRLGQIALSTIDRNSWTGISINGFVSHHPQTRRARCAGKRVLGGLDALESILEEHQTDAVYLALPSSQASVVPMLLKRLEKFAVDVRVIPDVPTRLLPERLAVSVLDGMPIISYRESPVYGLGGISKRALDLVGGSLALILFSPLMLLIALGVKLTTPGPAIFRQRRVSIGGETFKIYKFRTMSQVSDESGDGGWTRPDDPRITTVGKWLRRTSLDELPQLINVIRGDMSLVGPRPERPELIARFREDWRGYMLRQHVKAGMTGWAQVHGLRGNTSLRKRLQYDIFYVRHWSVWFDLRILVLTLVRGFVNPNAY